MPSFVVSIRIAYDAPTRADAMHFADGVRRRIEDEGIAPKGSVFGLTAQGEPSPREIIAQILGGDGG